MPEVLIKGETHSSEKDKQELLDLDLSRFDAVFREGHDRDYFKRDITLGYLIFAIGHLLYGGTYARFYESGDEFKEKVEAEGIPWVKMDADVAETFEMVPRWKRGLLLLLSPIMGGLLFGFASIPFQLALRFVAPGWIPVIGAVAVIFLFGFACALGYFLLIEEEVMSDRDDYMAEKIVNLSEKEGYKTVLVSCGGKHRPGIAASLRDEGWEVRERGTRSLLGRILAMIERAEAAVLRPRQTVGRIWSWAKNR